MTVPTFLIRSCFVLWVSGRKNVVESKAGERILNPLRLPFRHSGQPCNYNLLGGEGKARKARFRHGFRQSRFVRGLFTEDFKFSVTDWNQRLSRSDHTEQAKNKGGLCGHDFLRMGA